MGFSEQAWTDIAPIYRAILDHDFNRSFTDGSLSQACFRHYMLEDALYLNGFGRALAACAARAPDNQAMVVLAEAAKAAVVVERALHEEFFGLFGLSREDATGHTASPTCTGYAASLIAASAHEPVEVAVAALVPCFRIYLEVGRHQMDRAVADHPYQAWIDTYADPEFEEGVRQIERLTDRLADAATEAVRADMLRVYRQSSRYEWMFWDAAWRMERWPV
ncbi:TenA family protein [Marinivivus vitaminiproducens]|uniref:TenA family protein n=1 Tax=Marinivivus vitaminiproducens TaxID=3035935 RepID=UPI0027AAFE75|nr:TenA family protein [Geminicoccaceae bacterium SCSIO 64248]